MVFNKVIHIFLFLGQIFKGLNLQWIQAFQTEKKTVLDYFSRVSSTSHFFYQ